MSNYALLTLSDHIASDRKISADEAVELRKAIFPDGVVSRAEADVLVALAGRVANSDEAWEQAFVEAIVDHVLQAGVPQRHVNEASVEWLKASFAEPSDAALETLLKVAERAESMPESLLGSARALISAQLAGKTFSAADVEWVRRCLYAGDSFVGEDEARWLFALDAESHGRPHDAAWADLFVKAVLNHLMGRQAPSLLDAEGMKARQAWLEAPHKARPLSNILAMLSGGWKNFAANATRMSDVDQFETHYEAANSNTEEDAELTPVERAWALGMTREDGKQTANEAALLDALSQLEA